MAVREFVCCAVTRACRESVRSVEEVSVLAQDDDRGAVGDDRAGWRCGDSVLQCRDSAFLW